MRLIVTGDVHLGRSSSHVVREGAAPADLDVSARGAWHRVIDLATERDADALLVTGDLVDRDEAFYEARAAVRGGLERLLDARPGIRVIAVTGNHDHKVLPRVLDALDLPADRVSMVGNEGSWVRTSIGEGANRVVIDGWGYPTERPRARPLDELSLPEVDGPRLVLLHGEYDTASSEYAAIPAADARQLAGRVDALLLGHVHFRGHEPRAGDPPVLYAGSPQALDPGEPGRHGCWELEIGPGGITDRIYHGLSTVRYDGVMVDAADLADEDDLRRHLDDVTGGWLEEDATVEAVIPRLTVTGTHDEPSAVRSWAGRLEAEWEPVTGVGHLDRAEVRVARPTELGTLAREDAIGPLPAAARLLTELRAGEIGPDHPLYREALAAVRDARDDRHFRLVSDEQDDDERARVRAHLDQALGTLIEAMTGAPPS